VSSEKAQLRALTNFVPGLAILGLSILVEPSTFAQKTSTSFDHQFSFSRHRCYAWRENRLVTQQHPDTNEMVNLKIVKEVNRILNARGFVEVKDKPDSYLYYDGGGDALAVIGGDARVNSTSISPNDRTLTYGLGNGPAMAPASWLKVNGQIVFHMMDATSRKTIWETVYSKTFRDPDKALRNFAKEVNELVSKSFKDFPPKSQK
jgi:hypothetical protein